MAASLISCFFRSFRSLVAFCELINKGFLTFKVYYSSSSRWYLRKLKIPRFTCFLRNFASDRRGVAKAVEAINVKRQKFAVNAKTLVLNVSIKSWKIASNMT